MRQRHLIVCFMVLAVVLPAAYFATLYLHLPFGPGAADFSTKLFGDYSIYRTSSDEIIISPQIFGSEAPIIPTKVVECVTDRHLILAKRQVIEIRNLDGSKHVESSDAVFDYWILDATAPKVFGQLNLEQFSVKRRELLVPESVTLKDVYSFRPWLF